MNKLFYFLIIPLFLYSCSDDENDEVITKDVDYNIVTGIYENSDVPNELYMYIHTKESWNLEGFGKIQTSVKQESNTITITFGDLEYVEFKDPMLTRSPETRTTIVPYALAPNVKLPENISKIVLNRKDKTDIYNINFESGHITITKEQGTFSEFEAMKYLIRPENVVSVYSYKNPELIDSFIEYASASVSLSVFEYDTDFYPLWSNMQTEYAKLYRYNHSDDYKKLEVLFREFCKKNAAEIGTNKVFNISDWTGKGLDNFDI